MKIDNMFKNKYVYDKDSLSYIKISLLKYYKVNVILAISLMVISIVIVMSFAYTVNDRLINIDESRLPTKQDVIIGSNEWSDSVFLDYQVRAELYLNRPEFKNSSIKSGMLSLAAHNAYDSTGILLPVELALAQGQWESGLGLKGLSPINNPYNVGEYDNGTVLWYDNTFEGIQAYYFLMTRNYLKCKPLKLLFKNFTNCSGYRYASGDYEAHVPKQYYYIKRWLKKELKKSQE